MDDADFYRWYGPWDPLTPGGAAELLAGMSAPWWVAGGWAIDAFTGRRREHEDIDLAFFRDDLPAVLDHLLAEYCVWSNHGGTMRPLRSPGNCRTAAASCGCAATAPARGSPTCS